MDISELAQSWLNHCYEQASYFEEDELDEEQAAMWAERAEQAEAAIKQAKAPTFDEVAHSLFHHPDFVVGNCLSRGHLVEAGYDLATIPRKLQEWAGDAAAEVMWEIVGDNVALEEDSENA